jgi:hypothetical protein
MATEIIPKPIRKASLLQNILLYFAICLLLFSIGAHFALDYFVKKSDLTLQDLEETLARERTEEEIILEKEVFDYKRKVEDFSILISQHAYASRFFNFFESLCHPKVWFSKINLDMTNHKLIVSGKTDTFLILDQQLLIFQQEELIKETILTKLSIGNEGLVNFTFDLTFNPIIVKK